MKSDAELKKYLNGFSSNLGVAVLIIFMGLFIFATILTNFDSEEIISYIMVVFGGGMTIVGLWMFKSAFTNKKEFEKTFRELSECNLINLIIDDFNAAQKISSDKGRLGNKYLYIKKSNTFFTYDKIVQVYEYVHKTNFVIDERSVTVRYLTKEGKILEQKLPVTKPIKNTEEPKQIMVFLLSKNPNIKVGYTK